MLTLLPLRVMKRSAPLQIANRNGSLFVITQNDVRNGANQIGKNLSLIFDASKPYRKGILSCFVNPNTKELVLLRQPIDGFVYHGCLIAAIQKGE